jgi:hypothetical protein
LKLRHGSEVGKTVEDQEDVEAVEGELRARLLCMLGLDGRKSPEHHTQRVDPQAPPGSVGELPDRAIRREYWGLAQQSRVVDGRYGLGSDGGQL